MVGPTGRFQRLGIIGQRADWTSDRRRRYVLSWAKARVLYSELFAFREFAEGIVPASGPGPNLCCDIGFSPLLLAFRLQGRGCRLPKELNENVE